MKKITFLNRIVTCALAFLLSLCGAFVSMFFTNEGKVIASAATIEYQDLLGVENRDWGAASDEYYFGGVTLSPYEYFNSANSVSGCWYHGNSALISNNNGVDILQYIYVNDKSARDAITENVNKANPMVGSSGWLTNPAASPVYVETTNGSGIIIKILKAYAGDTYTLTFKAGFSLIRNDGNTIYVSDDIVYNCVGNVPTKVEKSTLTFQNESGATIATKRVANGQTIGELPAIPEKAGYAGFWTIDGKAVTEDTIISANKTVKPVYGLEYNDYLGLEDRSSWASGHSDIVTFGLMDFSVISGNQYFKSSISDCWYQGNASVITSNNGFDILQFVYLNGVSARDLLIANQSAGKATANTGSWLSNPAAWPIAFETGTDCWIRVDKTAFGGDFTFTFKAGFFLIRNDGKAICLSEDVDYKYSNGALGKVTKYTLTFDGVGETKTLENGQTIGVLPTIPAKDGCEGVWMIDDVEITADTVYNYSENKTATAVYSKDITETIGLGDWGVPESESDIRYLWIRNNGAEISATYPNAFWNDHEDNKDYNFGVDIMDYILIDGESVRALINKNASDRQYMASSTFPLNIGGIYAPVSLETASDGARFKVMVDFKTSFNVTFKAGFTMITTDGVRLYVREDVTYHVGSAMGDIVKEELYILSFEGLTETKTLKNGQMIGELPVVPEKQGYTAIGWSIDGNTITAESIYNYGADKTATPVYEVIKQEQALDSKISISTWNMQEEKVWMHCGLTFAPVEVDWHTATAEQVAANKGVNPIDYIYIDGISVREHLAIDANAMGVYTYGSWTNALVVKVNPAYLALGTFTIQYKAGLVISGQNSVYYTLENDTKLYGWTGDSFGTIEQYTLTFADGTTKEVFSGRPIGELPEIPELNGQTGDWTINGIKITEDTLYTFGSDKTAVIVYSRDITKSLALEDRTSWGAHNGEFYLGVLDTSEANKVVNGESITYYLNASATGCWYVGNNDIIAANGGVDIMEYIYINGQSARTLITENANGKQLVNSCGCWLSNPAASPVYVETTADAGIVIRVLASCFNDYFDITFKSGFSLITARGVNVYLTEDVTYKYVNFKDGVVLEKGEVTEADLDKLGGGEIELMVNGEVYLSKTTRALTLPNFEPIVGDENTVTKMVIGWTTDITNVSDLYPVGYRLTLDPNAPITLHAVWMGFAMQDGAAVRMSVDSSGIRFLTDIDSAAYKNYVAKGLISEIGTIVCPTDYLKNAGELKHSSFPSTDYYMTVNADKWTVNEGKTWTYAAALVNISVAQYNRSMSARGYLKVNFTTGADYVYTPYADEDNARSIYEVAVLAYNDDEMDYKNNNAILEYVNKVIDLTIDKNFNVTKNGNAVGNYSVDATTDGAVITITTDMQSKKAISLNGVRLVENHTSGKVIEIEGLYFEAENCIVDGNTITITLTAANELAKASAETLYFESSDADLDFFLNDYFKRHSGYVEDGVNLKVNSTIAGVNSEEFFSHEWMSMSYYWFNSYDGYDQDRIAGLRKFLSTVPVDDYGYVWSSNDRVRDAYSEVATGEQKMGWPFPNNDSVDTIHWEFNGKDSKSWSDNIGASVKNGLRSANVSNQTSDIIFQSNTWKSYSTGKIYTYYAPLLEFELRIDNATGIDDIYVGYTTNTQTTLQWLSVKEYAFIAYDYAGEYNHVIYMPMYAFSGWGASTSTYITQIQIKIDIKNGSSLNGNVGLNYVRPTLDTRMSNNNSILISSLRTDYDYTGDLTYLQENITRARKSMNFLMQMYDATRGLKKESYIVGHDAKKESLDWLGNAKDASIAGSISQGYWDIMFMPEYDFQSNMYFYKALVDMAYLEDVLAENNITVDTSFATVKTANRSYVTSTSAYTSNNLKSVANTVLTNLRQTTENTNHTGFWNASTGRFVAGYSTHESKWYDYGYVTWNLEAIYYGIATEEQAASIMNWLNSEGSLYDYVFAPRSNTVEGTDMLNGEYAAMKGDWDFGDNCQYGGAIMYSSFYDLMARIDTLGADNAFERLTAIQEWYQEVYDYYVAHGSDPNQFYRYYYDNKGIQLQGLGTAGSLGLDAEFLESFLPVSAVAYGFFGIDSIDGKTLEIAPEFPGELSYWKMENLAFNMVKYDLMIMDGVVQISNVRGNTAGLQFQIALDYVAGQTVYVNGVAVSPTKVENGKAFVNVAMGAVIVEIR